MTPEEFKTFLVVKKNSLKFESKDCSVIYGSCNLFGLLHHIPEILIGGKRISIA